MAPFQRLPKLKSLVEIHHQAHLGPDRLSDGLDRREVIGKTLAAKTQLLTLETALLA
jgi:energy-coupling factor transporter ATP-binding protein EcfA2